MSAWRRRLILAGAAVAVFAGAFPAIDASAAPPEYSLEGTCAVVALHPDSIAAIVAGLAAVDSTVAVSNFPASLGTDDTLQVNAALTSEDRAVLSSLEGAGLLLSLTAGALLSFRLVRG